MVHVASFPEALRKSDEILNIIPDDLNTLTFQVGIAQAQGDLRRASALLARLRPSASDTEVIFTEIYQSILERRPMEITSSLRETLAAGDPTVANFAGELRFWLGWAEQMAADHSAAEQNWREGREEVESLLKNQPENDMLIGDLALINMALGDKAQALTLAERAMAANPIETDAMSGPGGIEVFARVAAQTGERDRAIAALRKLLSIPYLRAGRHASYPGPAPTRSDVRPAPKRSRVSNTRFLDHKLSQNWQSVFPTCSGMKLGR